MKCKLRFILPRLLAVTLLIGAASFVLFIVFKLLLAVAAIAGLVFLAGKIMGKNRFRGKWKTDGPQQGIMPQEFAGYDAPVSPYKTAAPLTIVPIR